MNSLKELDPRYEICKDGYVIDHKTGKTIYPRIHHRGADVMLKTKSGKFKHFSLNRLICEKYSDLTDFENYQVHHSNRVLQDNRSLNLMPVTKEEHSKLHTKKCSLKAKILAASMKRKK